MTELDTPFSIFDVSFKSYVDRLIPIIGLLPWKKTKSVGYDIEHSYE